MVIDRKAVSYTPVSRSEEDITITKSESDNTLSHSLTYDDIPLIIASFACFVSFLIYGASAGSLGAALPALAAYFGQSETKFGFVFTARGIGYCFGTLSSAAFMEVPTSFHKQKAVLVCLSTIIIGVFTGMIPLTKNYHVVLVIFWLQGFGFGMLDTFANCLLPELWGNRVGPWMQGLHCCFGIGAIIGPALVGTLRFQETFYITALSSLTPSIIMIIRGISQCISGSRITHASHTEDIDDRKDLLSKKDVILVPWSIKLLIAFFFFIYVGAETAYGGWVTAYSLAVHITSSEGQAAYLVSYFWGSIAFGRMLAIFLAIFVSNTKMLRFQLFLSLSGAILMLFIITQSYINALIVTIIYGFALSSIFPLAMILVNDYDFTMDAKTTSLFVVGATCGEAIIPIAVGLFMEKGGRKMFPISILIFTFLLVILYIIIHIIATKLVSKRPTRKSMEEDRMFDDIDDNEEFGTSMSTSSSTSTSSTLLSSSFSTLSNSVGGHNSDDLTLDEEFEIEMTRPFHPV